MHTLYLRRSTMRAIRYPLLIIVLTPYMHTHASDIPLIEAPNHIARAHAATANRNFVEARSIYEDILNSENTEYDKNTIRYSLADLYINDPYKPNAPQA